MPKKTNRKSTKTTIKEKNKVEKFIDEKVRPYLQSHGGDIEVVELKKNIVRVKLCGACHGCPMAVHTLQYGVQEMLNEKFSKEGYIVEQAI